MRTEVTPQPNRDANGNIRWDHTADVVVIGAGVAGLPAAISARDHGASVIVVDENFDIGGRGMLSGGSVQLGGGHGLQKKFGIEDSRRPDFRGLGAARPRREPVQRPRSRPHVRRRKRRDVRVPDRERRRVHREADRSPDASTVDRIFVTKEWHIPSQVIAPHRNRNGSGLVRRLEESARKKGAQIFLKHKMTEHRPRDSTTPAACSASPP